MDKKKSRGQWLIGLFLGLTCNMSGSPEEVNTRMWWVHSIKDSQPLQFAVETSRYGFVFDYEKLNFESFSVGEEKMNVREKPNLTFGIETYDKLYPCTASSLRTEDCQLVHTGRFLQHRFINWIPGLTGCDPHHSGLDIVAANDRLALTLQVVPGVDLRSRSLVMGFSLPESYHQVRKDSTFTLFKHAQSDIGFVVLKTPQTSMLTVTGTYIEARTVSETNFPADTLVRTGLIIYPVNDIEKEWEQIVIGESCPLMVTATQVEPVKMPLALTYDPCMGWHKIALRNDLSGDIEKDNYRMERVHFTIENPQVKEASIRLNFSKDTSVYAITGVSGVIRDREGFPTGIPMQLSKNWHTIDFNHYKDHRYKGPWFHGITELKIPPGSKIELEYTGVNAFWGTIPAASHAQLCLIGWGQNQQWDQSAIGAWGETICYEPDLDQASAPVLDMRPLFVLNPEGAKWDWTGNVGGIDFFNLRKADGTRAWHTALKTDYRQQCPNLTEVEYSGYMLDGAVDLSYTTSIGRSDDYVRGLYKLRMQVNGDINFEELDIFQMAAATYHYVTSSRLATGNEKGLIREWKAADYPPHSDYIGNKIPCKGEIPWFGMFDSKISPDQTTRFLGGDRGFIIREWNARIQGKENVPPYWQEYFTKEGWHGPASSVLNITLPETCKSLLEGDYIEAEIEVVILPEKAGHYYGSNVPFRNFLTKYAGKWQLIHREVIGNHLVVKAKKGIVKKSYPVIVEAVNNEAVFSVEGGVGYVPLIITGLTDCKRPELYEKQVGKWLRVDQSVHGNDYWQTDLDPENQTYRITYNVETDKIGNRERKEYRFLLKEKN